MTTFIPGDIVAIEWMAWVEPYYYKVLKTFDTGKIRGLKPSSSTEVMDYLLENNYIEKLDCKLLDLTIDDLYDKGDE